MATKQLSNKVGVAKVAKQPVWERQELKGTSPLIEALRAHFLKYYVVERVECLQSIKDALAK